MKRLAIGIFETQLLRTYILSDKGDMVRQLQNNWHVVFFTNSATRDSLVFALKAIKIDAKVVVAAEESSSKIRGFFRFLLRWSEPSLGTIHMLNIEKFQNRIGPWGFVFRYLLHRIIRNFDLLKKVNRWFYFKTVPKDTLINYSDLNDVSIAFITSLTDLDYDVPFAISCKHYRVATIATVRSWDNLVTKGVLCFEPDFFIAHTDFMNKCAVENHAIRRDRVHTFCCPAYQENFRPRKKALDYRELKVGFACMGPQLNPDEINLINWLTEYCLENRIDFQVIQHPKFQHYLPNLFENTKTLAYELSTLRELYDFLSNYRLIIGGGTTLLVDACFAKVPVIALGFEIEEQEFWNSALRWFDFAPHSEKFFRESGVQIAKSLQELRSAIELHFGPSPIEPVGDCVLKDFTGDFTINFNLRILKLVSDLKS